MFDDKSKSVGERIRINVHDDYEICFWLKNFGVSPNELRCAVSKVGVFADDVARELGQSRSARCAVSMPVGMSWCGLG